MDHSFSNRLLTVPLFQGFSRLDFLDIVEKIPFDFRRIKANGTIVSQGDETSDLYILLVGDVECEIESPEHTYRFIETLHAPLTIQIENLFGLHNRYGRTFKAKTECQLLLLSKQSVRTLLLHNATFQINFYNALSTLSQNLTSLLWLKRAENVEKRFATFIRRRSLRPIGEKKIQIRMDDLALELGTTRLRVSQMLSRMSEKKLLFYSRGCIIVPQSELL